MKTNQNIPSFDDIVFEKRDKEYGAYSLRKNYSKNLLKAFSISTAIILIVVFSPAIAKWFAKDEVIKNKVVRNTSLELMEAPSLKEDIEKPMEVQLEVKIEAPVFVAPEVVKEDIVEEEFKTIEEVKVDNPNQGNGNTGGGDIGFVEPIKEDVKVIERAPEIEAPLLIVEEMPEFPGGEAALIKYLSENIKYPQVAKENQIQGTVYLNFVVEADGSITNVVIARGVDASMDKEAVRVIRSMQRWKPGKQSGKTVRVKFNLPVRFVLQ